MYSEQFRNIHRKISLLDSLFNNFDSKDTKEALTQVFSCEFCEISKNTFLTELIWTTASKYYACLVKIVFVNLQTLTEDLSLNV